MKRRRFVPLGLALVAALLPACGGGGGRDDGFRLDLDGHATIVDDRGIRYQRDSGRHRLQPGDTIRVVDGDGVLELPGDREVLLREGSEVVAGVAPKILDGGAVVVADGDAVNFSVGSVDAQLATGAARVQRGLGVTIALYGGDATVRSAGRTFEGGLPALRQITVPATGLLPRAAVPLVYNEKSPDAWDRRFLGDAILFGRYLDTLSRGFTSQLGTAQRASTSLLREVLPALATEPAFGDDLFGGDDRSPGEALVGAAIVVESGTGSFLHRWDSVFGFRADGAPWGLVALDQEIRSAALRQTLDAAIARSPLLFAVGGPLRPATTTTATTVVPPPPPPETTTTTQPDDGGDEPIVTIPTLPPPGDEPPDDQPEDLIGGLIDDLLP